MNKQDVKQQQQPIYVDKGDEPFMQMVEWLSRVLIWTGVVGTLGGIAFLIFTYVTFSGGIAAADAQALGNIDIFSKILLVGLVCIGISSAFVWWGEETLAVLQLSLGAALYFAPLYVPQLSSGIESRVTLACLDALRGGGQVFGAIAIAVLIADVTTRIRLRSQQGSKADQLRYGKGVKEERDIRNVFLGKCWQLPFCRKFVRERCPIYHSRRTCWKERVGCMCEEEVIRGAMENKPIPKDQLMAVKFIPYNNRLTSGQKAERCRQCVIYNEHQKHKYKLALPATIIGFMGFYAMFREPLLTGTRAMIERMDKIVAGVTYRNAGAETQIIKTGVFEEILLVAFLVVAFAYAMKVLEFLIFKLKV